MNHSSAQDPSEVARLLAHKPGALMRAPMAIVLRDRMPGGMYAPPHHFKEDYREAIQALRGKPEQSYYNTNTPKMWPIKTNSYSNKPAASSPNRSGSTASASASSNATGCFPRGGATVHGSFRGFSSGPVQTSCSLSAGNSKDDESSVFSATSPIFSVFAPSEKIGFMSGSISRSEAPLLRDQPLSALQQTLLSCGKLKHAEHVVADPVRVKVDEALAHSLMSMREHAEWLQEKERRRNGWKGNGVGAVGPNSEVDRSVGGSVFGGDSTLTLRSGGAVGPRRTQTRYPAADGALASGEKINSQKSSKNSLQLKSGKRSKALYSGVYNNELPPEGVSEARSIKGYADMNELEDRLDIMHASLAAGEFDKRSRISYKGTCDISGLQIELARPSYSALVLKNIGASAPDCLGNPYRQLNADKHMQLRGSPSLDSLSIGGASSGAATISSGASRLAHKNKDNRIYGKSQKVCSMGSYIATIRSASSMAGGTLGGGYKPPQPTLRDVTESTALLSRKQLLAYDTRIVETGAILKALQDLRHKSPGLTAIISFHRNLVASAIINPNPYFISRAQLRDVIYDNVPWMDRDAVGRLISSYDPYQTGFVRYIRLSSAIIAGNRPSMSGLISSLNNGSKAEDPHGVGLVLALIYGLYQDCEGQQTTGNAGRFVTGGAAGDEAKGMKLSDMREALSCCVCSAADEVNMSACADSVVQELFESMQFKGLRVDSIVDNDDETIGTMSGMSTVLSKTCSKTRATVMLSHGTLSSMAHIEVVSQDDFTRVILDNREVYDEFARQLLQFRGLVAHFAHVGSVSYAKAKHEKSIYGTQSFS